MGTTKQPNSTIDQKLSHQNYDNFNIFTEVQKLHITTTNKDTSQKSFRTL